LTADRLANAISIAVTDAKMKQSASSFGQSIRAENGIRNAIEVIRKYIGNPETG
jgi:UDP:flavonoid glycosyltransferase YjiC (YdhE family)